MKPNDLSTDILRTKQEIERLKQQIDTASAKEKRRLQHQLKELQILQLWQIGQEWDNGINSKRS